MAAKLAAWVNYICPVEGARDAMVKIDDTLVDNPLIFPSEEDLKDTFDFMVLDEAAGSKVRRRVCRCHRWLKHAAGSDEGSSYDGLRMRGLTKEFANFTAVKALDLDVPSGSFFALLGPSGCGKTTTLRMVAGLETPTSGTIELEWQGHHLGEALPASGEHRLPELCAVPAPRHLRERRLRPAATQEQGCRPAGARHARARRARVAGSQAADAALGWPAAAGCARPGADQPARGAAARRAARRPRPEAAPVDADRDQADPDRGRAHVRARHARPGGGHDDGRHDRGDEPRRDRADGRSRPSSTTTRRRPSWPTSSASPT